MCLSHGMMFITTFARCSGSVTRNDIQTLKRSTILTRSSGQNHSRQLLAKSWWWMIHLNLKNRNELVKYQWQLWNKSIDALKGVKEIKQKCQAKLIVNRSEKKKNSRKYRTSKWSVRTSTSSKSKEKQLEEKMVQQMPQDVYREDDS